MGGTGREGSRASRDEGRGMGGREEAELIRGQRGWPGEMEGVTGSRAGRGWGGQLAGAGLAREAQEEEGRTGHRKQGWRGRGQRIWPGKIQSRNQPAGGRAGGGGWVQRGWPPKIARRSGGGPTGWPEGKRIGGGERD